jgi:molybdenum cofactor guanylyltransferase
MLTITILAGGQSRRMGQDKADIFLPMLLERTKMLAPTVIVGRDDLMDAIPNQGPLGGILTALRHTNHPILVLACDMPAITSEAVAWLIAQWETTQATNSNALGLVTRHPQTGDLEPLFAVYSPLCLPLIEAALASGKRSMHGLLGAEGFTFLDAPETILVCFTNINTPEELEAYLNSTE